jgi:predicted nucleic acid-binding protein
MLYLDTSALIKHYVQETGTENMTARLAAEVDPSRVLTSAITYAEIHAGLARKLNEGDLRPREFFRARREFDSNWAFAISPVELGTGVLLYIKNLVRKFSLTGADAIHLASALWIRDVTQLSGKSEPANKNLVFATSDQKLGSAAKKCRIEVFDPQVSV